jgi:hypothetical protein
MADSLGIVFTSNEIYYVALSGTKQIPVFDAKNRIVLPANHDTRALTGWFETQLELIFANIPVNTVGYKLSITNVTNSLVTKVYYAQGILNLICHKMNKQIKHFSPSAIVPSKFNQPQGTDLDVYIDAQIGTHPPHWNDKMRTAGIIALILLP